jgi:hypothetical protein
MQVRTRRMKNFGNGVITHEGSSSSNEDTEMMDARLQERLEAFNEKIQSGPMMVNAPTRYHNTVVSPNSE